MKNILAFGDSNTWGYDYTTYLPASGSAQRMAFHERWPGRVQQLLGPEYRITRCHGQWVSRKGVDIIATYHPAALLRDASKKRAAWQDLQVLRARLEEKNLYGDLLKET